MRAAATPYPAAVTGWLTGGGRRRVLDLGTGRGGLAHMLAEDGHHVTCLDQDLEVVHQLAGRHLDDPVPTALATVAGQTSNLPFADQSFEIVTCAQVLHRFAPGLALAEAARVLRPQGWFGVVYNTRDDTVPWVKRLTRLVQQYDPTIMSGDFGHGSITALEESPYFGTPEKRSFRNWIPVTRPQMLAVAQRNDAVRALPDAQRDALLAEVGELYDSSARAPEPLLLPWQVTCWRAEVDHSQIAFSDGDDGLDIALDF